MKNENGSKCSFCNEVFESKKAVTNDDGNVFICVKCVKAVDLSKTPDGVSKHPRANEVQP